MKSVSFLARAIKSLSSNDLRFLIMPSIILGAKTPYCSYTVSYTHLESVLSACFANKILNVVQYKYINALIEINEKMCIRDRSLSVQRYEK